VCLFVSLVSVWPCDGLATCPGVPASRPMTAGTRQAGRENGWMDGWMDGWMFNWKNRIHTDSDVEFQTPCGVISSVKIIALKKSACDFFFFRTNINDTRLNDLLRWILFSCRLLVS